MSDQDFEVRDDRKVPIFIHSELDDLGLTPEAFRVYCHLVRRAGNKGQAFPKISTIGAKCFPALSRSKNGKPCRIGVTEASQKRMTLNALSELEQMCLIKRIKRKKGNGKQTSNVYILLDKDVWATAEITPRTRREKKPGSPHEPGQVHPTNPVRVHPTNPKVFLSSLEGNPLEVSPSGNFSEQPEETKPSPVNQAPIVETSNPTALKGKTTPLPPSYMSLLPAKPDRPWKTGNGGNDWNEEFVQAILVYLKGLPNSEGKTRADAINWISVRQNLNHEAHDSLWARWEEFKAKKKAPAKMTDEEFNDLSLRSIARNDAKTAFIRSCGLKGTFALDAWDALPTAERKILYRQHYEILKSA